MKLCVDVSSILWSSLLTGEDKENGYIEELPDGRTRKINTANYGLDIAANSVATVMNNYNLAPKDFILVIDGPNGKQMRTRFLADYKAGRDKSQAQYDEYNKLQDMFVRQMLGLGAVSVFQMGMEADDVLGFLAKSLQPEPVTIWTRDKDLLVLTKPGKINVLIKDELNPKSFGDFPWEFIDVYKATVGDTSDNIPGAKGFGPKAFEKVYAAFGNAGMVELRRLIRDRKLIELQEDVATVKELSKLIDYEEQVHKSWRAALLYTQLVDPNQLYWEWGVNKPGSNIHPRLAKYAQTVTAVDVDNFKEKSLHVIDQVKKFGNLAFDIETSTCEESDEWVDLISSSKDPRKKAFDQFGHELTGFSMTYGINFEHTIYVAVDHADTKNVSLEDVKAFFLALNNLGARYTVHNSYFELTVMQRTLGFWLHDMDDTFLMASYIDENKRNGLKTLSKDYFKYEQATYEETTQGRRMNELTLDEVLSYGADDTIMTAGLSNVFGILMRLEGVWETYRQVEIDAAYLTAQAFNDGLPIDMVQLAKLAKRDEAERQELLKVFHQFLIDMGWDGTQYLEATPENYQTVEWIKWAASTVMGESFTTRKRKLEAVLLDLEEVGQTLLAGLIREGDLKALNRYVESHFKGEPNFNVKSPKQLQHFLYEVLGLPIRLRGKPTDLMKQKGLEGTPQTDELAIQTALVQDVTDSRVKEVLKTLMRIKRLETRESLYYSKYINFPHWKDGLIHAQLRQNSTVTRRYSGASPNLQQLSKGEKGDFRTVIVPHHKDALVVSLDFNAQELRVIADYGRDPNLVSCYVGDNLRDMHSMTAAEMAGMSYEEFMTIYNDPTHERHDWAKGLRKKAKIINFSSEYGIAAPKMAQNLMSTEEEAQRYLDAKFAIFSRSEEWKKEVINEAKELGYVTTKLGARRHLREAFDKGGYEASKAERQAVNYKIQGSSAEMTKLAMGRIWRANLKEKYDLRFYAPIHDEVVFSIAIKDMPKAVPEIHALMTAQYADMVIPVESSVSFGRNFGDQIECDDHKDVFDGVPTEANITAILNKLEMNLVSV